VGAVDRIEEWLEKPTPVLRLVIARVCAPLAVLGFASGRLAHADEWIGDSGFHVPDLGGDWRQPLFIPALPSWAAWCVAGLMVAAGLACAAGFKPRVSALVFAATLVLVTLSDRLETYTVTKLSPAVMIAIAFSPAGSRLGVDAWLRRRRTGKRARRLRASGSLRFLQLLLLTMYFASGTAKARGDWLKVPLVLYSHLHDSYQGVVSYALATHMPAWSWTVLQGLVLGFELLAPLWFGLACTRPWAFVFGMWMHLMIGLMFWPVRWLSLLMMTLLVAGFLPEPWLERLEWLAAKLEDTWSRASLRALASGRGSDSR
jgi:hypothetical protein